MKSNDPRMELDRLTAILKDLAFGAGMMVNSGMVSGAFLSFAKEVMRVAQSGLRDPEVPLKPRWKCSRCASTAVQVCLPTWFTESTGVEENQVGELTFVEVDEGADIKYWHCPQCEETHEGVPDAV